VRWYERANARSDYAATVLGAAASILLGSRTVLDVGAGFGALTVRLAAWAEHVTALEPSRAMVRALRRALVGHEITNVTIVAAAWGERPVPAHDAVVCAHVGPLLRPGSSFLAALPDLARRAVVLVRDVPGPDDKFFFSELYPRLLGRVYERGGGVDELLDDLRGRGIRPVVRVVSYRSDQPFTSLEEACEFWMAYLGRTDAATRRYLRPFLAARLAREGDGWIARYRKRAAVIGWRC
jgi:SAM-dependent methyltransferase